MFEFTINGNPATKKNHGQMVYVGSRGHKSPRLIPSKAYLAYESMAAPQCPALQIDYPVNVEAHYYMKTRRRVDLVNLHEALHDVLVKAKTLTDDNCKIIVSTDGSRVHFDKVNPRTEVFITKLKASD